MPVKIEIECPFDEESVTFTLMARVIMPKGEFMERKVGTWTMTVSERRFGPFTYSVFTLVSKDDEEISLGHDPEAAAKDIFRYHYCDVRRFFDEILRRYGVELSSWERRSGLNLGSRYVDIYKIKPKKSSRAKSNTER